MITRRMLFKGAGCAALLGAATSMTSSILGQGAGDDYRALVVLFLNGGCDGHNLLVPTDTMYTDYQAARQNLALPKSGLAALSGSALGHTFGLHSALAPWVPLYANRRLAFIANAGPLVEPTTPEQARSRTVDLPPFLFSHSDQIAIQQGWTVTNDTSGWAGRALELLPSELRNPLAAVSMDNKRTLVKGRHSPVTYMPATGARYWGPADLARPETEATQSINRMAHWQFANAYEAEFARTFGLSVQDQTLITKALLASTKPNGDFGTGDLATKLSSLASLLPVYKSQGLKRQVFLINWGRFDTHSNQRGSVDSTQDAQLLLLAKALAAFDDAVRAAGLDMNVVTLAMSDFGRTVRPGSGGGSEHAWGNHWFALGGPVQGGNVYGSFPSPVLGGPDDGDLNKNGRHVPTTSTDQVGATMMHWVGLDPSAFHEVFPNLANFKDKTIPLLRV